MPPAPPVFGPPGVPRPPKKVAWLALATLGIYGIVWFYRFGQEIDAAGQFAIHPKRYYKQMGIVAAFIVTLPVALIHFFVYAKRVAKHVDLLAVRAGESTVEVEDRFPVLLIPFAGVVYLAMLQGAANRLWARMARRSAGAAAASTPTATKRPA